MKIKLYFFKITGKFNFIEEVTVDKETFDYDFNGWALKLYGHKQGSVYIATIEDDGFEQPVRIVQLNGTT